MNMIWWNFLLFPTVGALIGALTNEIAIRMLFRPYEPILLWGRRLPFTPGLIPEKRHEIAKSIAESFERNLLSGDDIHKVITGPMATEAVKHKVDEMLAFLGPFAAMAGPFKPKIVAKILEGVEDVATQAVRPGGALHIGERIETRINAMDLRELEQLILDVARRQLQHITLFGGILGAIIGLCQALLALALAG